MGGQRLSDVPSPHRLRLPSLQTGDWGILEEQKPELPVPKPKRQKQQEAAWRKALSDLELHYAQHGSSPDLEKETTSTQNHRLVQDRYRQTLEERVRLWEAIPAIPQPFFEQWAEGKFFHQELAERLDREFARRQQNHLEETLQPAVLAPRKPRF